MYLSILLWTVLSAAAAETPPEKRIGAAVLFFENRSGDPATAHWSCLVQALLANQLSGVKAIRRVPGARFAFRKLDRKAGSALSQEQARRAGELIEAQRIVWGHYRREGGTWQAGARVLNVASGEATEEIRAESSDWNEIRDRLADGILRKLAIEPSEEERRKMSKRWTNSPEALEHLARAYRGQEEDEPLPAQERHARDAVAADGSCAEAHSILAAILGSQGKLEEAEKEVRRSLELDPTQSQSRTILGILFLLQGKFEEAEKALQEAHGYDPDDAEPMSRLGQLYALQRKMDDSIRAFEEARQLDPTDASTHAGLARIYAIQKYPLKAKNALREAERLSLGDPNHEQTLFMACLTLNEMTSALEHYENLARLAEAQGVNPEQIRALEKMAGSLKDQLKPVPVSAAPPRTFTSDSLPEALREKLTEEELKDAENPLASSPELKAWAERLTRGISSERVKADAIFRTLARRHSGKGKGGARTALEVLAAWKNPDETFSCQETAKLYVALAREAGLQAFYVHVDRFWQGNAVDHDCAILFAGGEALLVDVANHWFGVPHKEFQVLDDLQAMAHHLFQYTESDRHILRCRIAEKLDPDSAWGQVVLCSALIRADKWDEGAKALEKAIRLAPERWDVYEKRGIFSAHEGKIEEARGLFRKALEINPDSGWTHFHLAEILHQEGKLQEAKDEYHAALRGDPPRDLMERALQAIARINEELGRPDPPSRS